LADFLFRRSYFNYFGGSSLRRSARAREREREREDLHRRAARFIIPHHDVICALDDGGASGGGQDKSSSHYCMPITAKSSN
jgi:hypothetical protein